MYVYTHIHIHIFSYTPIGLFVYIGKSLELLVCLVRLPQKLYIYTALFSYRYIALFSYKDRSIFIYI